MRRRIVEASVRAPQDWHDEDIVEAAYEAMAWDPSDDDEDDEERAHPLAVGVGRALGGPAAGNRPRLR